MPMSKLDFLEKMKMPNHPILLDEDQLDMTFRYIGRLLGSAADMRIFF